MTTSASHLFWELWARACRLPVIVVWAGGVVVASAFVLAAGAMADGADVYPRGDADCSLRSSAVDIVAAVRGLGDASVCGNDDCDRDGSVSAADIDCTARCLFGSCPIPPYAPAVTSILPDSAAAVVAFSSVRVIGTSFGTADEYARVTFGGVEAAVADHPGPEELVVMVPPVGPGEVDVVVYRGDLEGYAFRVDVEAPVPIGAVDTFAGTLDLLDEMIQKFSQLDLDTYLGEEAATVREEIDRFRQELAAKRAEMEADPDFSPELRALLDDAFEGSGIPEQLRETIAEIESYPMAEAAAEGVVAADVEFTVAVSVAKNVIKTLIAVRNAAQTVALPASVAAEAPVAVGIGVPAMLGIGALAVAGAVIVAAVAAKSGVLAPVILDVTLFDPFGEESDFAIPGGAVEIEAKRVTPLSAVTLVVRSAGGSFFTLLPEETEGGLRFHFPEIESGFCRDVQMQLRHSLTGSSAPVRRAIQPRVHYLSPEEGKPKKGFNVNASGAQPCQPRAAIFKGFYTTARVEQCTQCIDYDFLVPEVVAGKYAVGFEVAGIPSEIDLPFTVLNPFTGLMIDCAPQDLTLFPATPNNAACNFTLEPAGSELPKGARIDWRSTDTGIASVSPLDERGTTARVDGQGPGTANISAALMSGSDELVTSAPVEIRVADTSPPSVQLTSDSPSTVPAGSAIEVTVKAIDVGGVDRVRLTATGEAVVEQQQLEFCPGDRTCEVSFTVDIKEAGFEERTVSIVAEAIDQSENAATSDPLQFTVAPEGQCPEVTILSPVAGSTIAASATVTVEAEAVDNRPGDTGVAKLIYSATGDALVQAVSDEQVLPAPVNDQPVQLSFDFFVKGAQALETVGDRTITISVEAIDGAGNTCGPQVTTVSAAAPAPEVSVTLTWDGVEDLDLLVNICQDFFCILNRNEGAGDTNGRCDGTGSNAVETIALSGGDAPLTGRYIVNVSYDQTCGAPLRPVPFHVHVEYDDQVLDFDDTVEWPKSVEVTQFSRIEE